MEMENCKNVAIDLAYEAGRIMKENFSLGMKKEWKSDNSPITSTDLAINQLIIETIGLRFPDHSIIGEEGSKIIDGSEYAWVCDPVDGTAPFSHGIPTFCFSLALTKNGESILGVIYDPIMDRLLVGEKGKGATLNGKEIRVSKADTFERAFLDLEGDFELYKVKELIVKEKKDAFVTGLYSAIYGGILVACGEFVAEVYEYKSPWDAAALKVIVEEAGGKVTDIFGNDQRYDQKINGFVASNGVLHDEIIKLIQTIKSHSKS